MASLEEVVRGAVLDGLAEYFNQDEMPTSKRCPQVVDSDAAVAVCIKALRERIDGLESRLAEVEKRKDFVPILTDPGLKDLLDAHPMHVWQPKITFTCDAPNISKEQIRECVNRTIQSGMLR